MTTYRMTLEALNKQAEELRSEIKEQRKIVETYEDEEDTAHRLVLYCEKMYKDHGEDFGADLDKAYADYSDASDNRRIADDLLDDLKDALEAINEAREAISKLIVIGL